MIDFKFISAINACFARVDGTFVLKTDAEKVFVRRLLPQVFLLMFRSRISTSPRISQESLSQIYAALWARIHSEELLEAELLAA